MSEGVATMAEKEKTAADLEQVIDRIETGLANLNATAPNADLLRALCELVLRLVKR